MTDASPQEKGVPCPSCGYTMVKTEACWKCLNCGTTSGCFAGALELYIGAYVLDPCNRRVMVTRITPDFVEVRQYGSYGARVRYPVSVLRPWVEPHDG